MDGIVAKAQVSNAEQGISGFLLWKSGIVAQALLGTEARVNALFTKIKMDSRHDNVTRLYSETEEKELFPAWPMKFWDLDREALSQQDQAAINAAFQPYQRTIIFAGLHL